MVKIWVASVLILVHFAIFSQEYVGYSFKHLTTEEGLSESQISEIVQDHKGFLWFGSIRGINRFDGREVKVFKQRGDSTSLSRYVVAKLFVDSKGVLWVGTLRGIGMYDERQDKFVSLDHIVGRKLHTGRVSDITEMPSGDIIFTSEQTLYLYNRTNNSLRDIAPKNLTAEDKRNIFEIESSPDENLYFTLFDKLYYYDFKTGMKYKVCELDNSGIHERDKMDYYVSFIIDEIGNIWMSTFSGKVFMYDHFTHKYSQIELQGSKVCNTIFPESDSTVLLSFDYMGIVRFNHRSQTYELLYDTESSTKSIGNNKILSIFIDRQKNLWLGHTHMGVSYTNLQCSGFKGVDFSKTDHSIFPVVSAIYKQSNGDIWVGTDGGGILKYNSNLAIIDRYTHKESDKTSLPDNAVLSIYEDSKGVMWIGTFLGGLSRFIPESNSFYSYQYNKNDSTSISHNDVRDIIEDSHGNLWLAVHGRLFNVLNVETEVFKKCNEIYDGPVIGRNFWSYDLEFDKFDKLWIAHSNGVMRYDTANNEYSLFDVNLPKYEAVTKGVVYAILADSKEQMWFCTGSGFVRYHYETDSFELITALPDESIQSAEEDKYGNFWIGTGKGMYKFNPETNEVRFFVNSDGLHGNKFVKNTSACRNKEELLFGLTNGFDMFHVDSLNYNAEPPQLEILSVEVMQEKLPACMLLCNKALVLPHYKNFITFEFAALNYINAEKNEYKYRLEGLENEWNVVGNERRAVYTSLPPGDYSFLVRASNNDGVWNDRSVEFKFSIQPPFWSRWWFRILFVSVVLGLFMLAHYVRILAIKKQKILLEKKVKFRTSELVKVNEELLSSKDEIEAQAEEIKVVNEKLRNKQNELEDSFHYAKNIQQFITPSSHTLDTHFTEHFLFHVPRDIVSGDFFWAKSVGSFTMFAVADCTGHGVPGAMISMLGINLLEELSVKENYLREMDTSATLNDLRVQIKNRLNHRSEA